MYITRSHDISLRIASTGSNVTSYTNAGLRTATTYYYRLCAYNSRGNSSYTGTASATTLSTITCTYSITSSSASFTSASGSGGVGVTASSGCTWSASTGYGWIHTTSSGSGSGTAGYTVDANTGTISRSGTLTKIGRASCRERV